MKGLRERIERLPPQKRAILEEFLLKQSVPSHSANIIARQTGEGPFLLSFSQERIWFLAQLEPESRVHNELAAYRVRGHLTGDALQASVNALMQRHAILRTTYHATDGAPFQIVQPAKPLSFLLIDLRSELEPDRFQRALEQLTRIREERFDLERDVMLRAGVVQLGDADHIVFFLRHHIATDGWATGILMREITEGYRAAIDGDTPNLEPLPMQYHDYAVWQRELGDHAVPEVQLAFWRSGLTDLPPLELATDRPHPLISTHCAAAVRFEIPSGLWQNLRARLNELEVTPFVFWLSVFLVLLHRYTGQKQLALGAPIANRTPLETESLIGRFTNMLVVQSHALDNPTFREFVQRMREVTFAALTHNVPFEQIVQAIMPERQLASNPLFQVVFQYSDWDTDHYTVAELTWDSIFLPPTATEFDVRLAMKNMSHALYGVLEYSTDLFDETTMRRMADHFMVLLHSILASPDLPISELNLLTDAERYRLLDTWNDTTDLYPHDRCVHELFEEQAARTPNAVAVVWSDKQWTYNELNVRANQLAQYMARHGVRPHAVVGVCLERTFDVIVSLLAVLKAGGTYLFLDSTYPKERLSYLTRDAHVSMLLTHTAQSDLSDLQIPIVCLDATASEIARESTANPVTRTRPDDLIYLIYTSGSTGQPKGTEIRHRGVVRLLFGIDCAELNCGTTLLQLAPLSFDASTFEIWGALLHGGRLVLAADGMPDLAELETLICAQQVNTLWLTASLFNLVVANRPALLCNVKQILTGGEALSVEHVRTATQFLASDAILINGYGPTESTTFATFYRVPRVIAPHASSIPIGRPIANTHVYVLDAKQHLVPIGVPGELYIGGDGLARGYLNRPDLTEKSFVQTPAVPGERLYRTGDAGRWLPDGNLEYRGRLDQQVKIRGHRVEPGEIEAVLGKHPAVQWCAVITDLDAAGAHRLIAYCVFRAGQSLRPNELLEYVRTTLPEYMVPSLLVPLDALPLTPSGKLDKKALPSVATLKRSLENELAAPRLLEEEAVRSIWCEVLGISEIGIHDNFFEIGGHSLLATQVIARIGRTFEIELPLQTIFLKPTVAGLTEQVVARRKQGSGNGASGAYSPIVAVSSVRSPLSFAQQRLWFLDQLEPNQPLYTIPFAFRLRGPLDVSALRTGLEQIITRHETLRTVFLADDGIPEQVVRSEFTFELPIIDLEPIALSERETTARRLAQQEAQQPFDLSQDLMLRAKLVRVAEQDHLLLLTMHHIAADGSSLPVFWRELRQVYRALLHHRSPTLSELPLQYAAYAAWQREWLGTERMQQQLAFWREQLAALPPLTLPTDRPRPAVPDYRGRSSVVNLSQSLVSACRLLARREAVTLQMLMLGALDVLLYRYSGQTDIAVGVPTANRQRVEIEPLVGFFVNTLVLRTELGGKLSFRDVLAHVRRVSLAAYDNSDVPFEHIVEALHPHRHVSRNPLFQVMFQFWASYAETYALEQLVVERVPLDTGTSKFDLLITLRERENHIESRWSYSTALFDDTTIERMQQHFTLLLANLLASPDQPISELPLGHEQPASTDALAEIHLDLVSANAVHELFEAQVELTPNAVAVQFGKEQRTFRQLNENANRLARWLRHHGVSLGSVVGICMQRSLNAVVTILAVLKAGGAYLPLDPDYPQSRLRWTAINAYAALILTENEFLPWFSEINVETVTLDALQSQSAPLRTDNIENLADRDSPAYVMYTSGSAGRPKGVVMPHGPLINLIAWHQSHPILGSPARTLQFSAMGFDVSFQEIFSTWCTGGTLVLVDEPTRQDPHALAETIFHNHIQRLFLPFVALQHLALAVAQDTRSYALKTIVTAGEQLRITAPLRQMFERLKDCILINHYGPTEAHVVSEYVLGRAPSAWIEMPPIGRAIPNVRLYVLDERLRERSMGVAGELYIGGSALAQSYLQEPGLTAAQFIPDPFVDVRGARMYRTGDCVRVLPNGAIQFLGRADQQVKIRGYRVELQEIAVVLNQHPDILQSVIDVRANHTHREQDSATPSETESQVVIAYVVPRPGKKIQTTKLLRDLRMHLPEYMVPSRFIVLDALPVTPNGKLDRRALVSGNHVFAVEMHEDAAPQTATEAVLAQLWREVLNVRQVGVNDSFFDLGGHSLSAVRLFARLQERLGHQFALSLLFQYPTIRELGRALDSGRVSDWQTLVPIQARGSRPPFFCVHTYGGDVVGYAQLAKLLDEDQPFFGLQAGGLNGAEALDQTIESMAARYIKAMRTVQPKGSYRLGGYCLGGVIAYEMACQLEAQGEHVEFLGIMEGYAPAHVRKRTAVRRLERLVALWRNVPYWLAEYSQLGVRGMRVRLRNRHLNASRRTKLRSAKSPGPSLDALPIEDLDVFPQHQLHLMATQLYALRKYNPGTYDGPLTVFSARTRTVSQVLFDSVHPDHGWSHLAQNTVRVELVEGNHRTIHLLPHVHSLAQALTRCLNKSISSHGVTTETLSLQSSSPAIDKANQCTSP